MNKFIIIGIICGIVLASVIFFPRQQVDTPPRTEQPEKVAPQQ